MQINERFISDVQNHEEGMQALEELCVCGHLLKAHAYVTLPFSYFHNFPDNKVVVICTGAQGEENAVLARIANGEHRQIKFKKQDTVIFSSSVIPGNERTVQKLKDLIYRQSDNVIHSEIMDVHSSGHASVEDFKEVIRQISSTYFMPVYANHYMLKEAAKLAREVGYTNEKIFVPDNGSILECKKTGVKMLEEKAMTDPVFVDGLGVSDLQNVVLRDRQILSEDGMLVVIATVSRRTNKLIHNPDIISIEAHSPNSSLASLASSSNQSAMPSLMPSWSGCPDCSSMDSCASSRLGWPFLKTTIMQ